VKNPSNSGGIIELQMNAPLESAQRSARVPVHTGERDQASAVLYGRVPCSHKEKCSIAKPGPADLDFPRVNNGELVRNSFVHIRRKARDILRCRATEAADMPTGSDGKRDDRSRACGRLSSASNDLAPATSAH